MFRQLSFLLAGATALFATAALADGPDGRCNPRAHQGCGSQVRVVFPPVGYVIDPSDALPPIYIVNQGPVFNGPNVYALPTFSEGVYADLVPYPYIGRGYYRTPYYYGYNGPGWSVGPRAYRVHGAYAYRPSASARVITVPGR